MVKSVKMSYAILYVMILTYLTFVLYSKSVLIPLFRMVLKCSTERIGLMTRQLVASNSTSDNISVEGKGRIIGTSIRAVVQCSCSRASN